MAKFQKCDETVLEMAKATLCEFETHKPIIDRGVRIDFLFAYGDRDETTGERTTDALKKNGVRALGICRKVSLKDRAKGMGDAEITLDHDHWSEVDEAEQRALLDHELHHIVVTADSDDLGRPVIKLRKHDFEVGWFAPIAQRHGAHSVERQQAKIAFDTMGQFFWPELERQHTDKAEAAVRKIRG